MSSGWPPNSYPGEYPTIKNTPQQPPKKKGMPLWGILLTAIGSVVVVSCVLCASIYALAPKAPTASIAEATNTPLEATNTPMDVLPAPNHMQIGASLTSDARGNPTIASPKTSFRGVDSFAWIFTSDTQMDLERQSYLWQFTDGKNFNYSKYVDDQPKYLTSTIREYYPKLSDILPAKQGVYCIRVTHILDEVGRACFVYEP